MPRSPIARDAPYRRHGSPSPGGAKRRFVDARASHQARFLRDGRPLDALAEVALPDLGAGAKSFGLVDVLRLRPETARAKHAGVELALRSFAILATDRWAAALARAPPGEYTLAEIERGLVPARRLTDLPARFDWK